MNIDIDKIRSELIAKTKDELNLFARQLQIPNFRKLSKDSLVEKILESDNLDSILISDEVVNLSWWSRNHNHVYGLATVVSLILGVLFFYWQNSISVENNSIQTSNSNLIIENNSNQSTNSTIVEEAQIASQSNNFSSISIEEFFKQYKSKSTDLQIEQFQKDTIGKKVIWTAKAFMVKSSGKDSIKIIAESQTTPLESVSLTFDMTQRSELLNLNRGDVIKFACVIDSYHLEIPFLEECRLLQIIQ